MGGSGDGGSVSRGLGGRAVEVGGEDENKRILQRQWYAVTDPVAEPCGGGG